MSPLTAAIAEHVGAARSAALIPGWLDRPINRDLRKFKLQDHFITEDLHDSIIDGEIVEGMAGALSVSLNVNDPSRNLVKRGILAKWVKMSPVLKKVDKARHLHVVGNPAWTDIYAQLDGRELALAAVDKNGNQFDMTFENRGVNELRKYTSHKVWYRDVYTRAMAIKAMIDEVKGFKIPFYCPELHKVQPITSAKHLPTSSQNAKTLQGGFSPGARVTVKGSLASAQQKSYEDQVIRTGVSMGAPYIILVASIMTITQESDVHIDTIPSAMGLFDQNPADGWPATGTDIPKDASAFFSKAIASYKANPNQTPGEIAQSVQISAYPSAYDQWETEAKATLALWGIPESTGSGTVSNSAMGSSSTTEFNRFAFTRGTGGKSEDSWTCGERLAQEVGWHLFFMDNTCCYVEDEQLFGQAPFDNISEKDAGIDEINFSIDSGRIVSQITVLCHVDRWQTPPGALVVVEDPGPAEGSWLVYETRWPLFGQQAEVTLQLPTPPKAEPAPTTKTNVSTTSLSSPGSSSVAVVNPVPGAEITRLDAGVDGVTKRYVAPYNGTFYNAGARWAGYGNGAYCYIVNDDQSGPDYTRAMYFAEDIVTSLPSGTHVNQGDQIGTSSGNAFEIGPAAASLNYDPLAHIYGTGTSGAVSVVMAFYNWLRGAGLPASSDPGNAGKYP